MGTHCAMVVRTRDGKIKRFERTLDGNLLINAFWNWAKAYQVDSYPSPILIGNGHLEEDEEGEGDQEYALVLDWKEKKFQMFGFTIQSKEQFRIIGQMVSDGWDWLVPDLDYYLMDYLYQPQEQVYD